MVVSKVVNVLLIKIYILPFFNKPFKMDLENPRTATALHFIALEYRSGAHIEYDPLQARVYFELAAKMGHAGACCDLALAYIKEDEEMKIKQDISKALEYITKGQESLV